jgi:[acyl-carrier-protein] S-malonyltransferase
VPLIANVRAAPVTDRQEIADLLVEQVTGQVRWRETVEWFAANGVTTLYEVGSGKVLTGLARRIDKSVTGAAVNGPPISTAALAPRSSADLGSCDGKRSEKGFPCLILPAARLW